MKEKKVSAVQLNKVANEYIAKCEADKSVPLLMEFAYLLGIDDSTLRRYVESKAYAPAIKRVEKAQEIALIKHGIVSNKPVFPIFLLKSKHGYQDTQKVDFTSNGETVGVVMLPARGE